METKNHNDILRVFRIVLRNAFISFGVSFAVITSNILDAFFHNLSEFDVIFYELMQPLAGATLIGMALVFIVLTVGELFLKEKSSVLFGETLGLAVAAWLQITLLNGVLNALDGTPMDFSYRNANSLTSFAVWAACAISVIVLGFVLRSKIKKIACYVLALLVLMQGAALVTSARQTGENAFVRSDLILDNKDQFSLGSDGNVVVLVFDTYSNVVFNNALSEHPEYKDWFKDFTYYQNANSVYCPTYPSVVHMITGQPIDLSISTKGAQKQAWTAKQTDEYYQLLHANGYTFSLYGITQGCLGAANDLYGKVDNVLRSSDLAHIDQDKLLSNLKSLGLYRLLPYPLKRDYWAAAFDQQGVVSFGSRQAAATGNCAYYTQLLENGINIQNGQKRIVVHHLEGLHAPYMTTEECGYIESGTQQQAAIGSLTLMKAYIDELITKNLYDNTTICFLADHGGGTYLQPMVLIKRANEQHDAMQTNSAPVTFSEMMPTILYMAGVEKEKNCRSNV